VLSEAVPAFAVRARTARAAERSLDAMYYIWHDDLTGRLLQHELMAAAERGVRVRLLLDDLNTGGLDQALRAMDAHPNLEVRLFNPARNRAGGLRRALEMGLRFAGFNRRMHNKAWIADNRLAIVGGRNVGDEYFDAAADTNFHDTDLLLLGPAVAQASAVFDAFWNSAAVVPLGALREGGEPWTPSSSAPAAPSGGPTPRPRPGCGRWPGATTCTPCCSPAAAWTCTGRPASACCPTRPKKPRRWRSARSALAGCCSTSWRCCSRPRAKAG
jgi:phosphatidylserine/phosphatidylglycerophosphate/cardiolipin synthase-like enzyme